MQNKDSLHAAGALAILREEYQLLSSPSQQWKLLAAIAVLIEARWTEANALAYFGTTMRHC
jgi:hypothetical protein